MQGRQSSFRGKGLLRLGHGISDLIVQGWRDWYVHVHVYCICVFFSLSYCILYAVMRSVRICGWMDGWMGVNMDWNVCMSRVS